MEQIVKTGDLYEVEIIKQDHFGRGLTRIYDMLVFVEGALPLEKCQIVITEVKKKYACAKVLEVKNRSVDRVTVKCPYYDICGGCHIMHQEYQKQLQFKEMKVKELLERNIDITEVTFFPILYANPFTYRNKVIFHGEKGKLGFYHEKTNQIVSVEECMITSKMINEIYANIRTYVNNHVSISKLMIRNTSTLESMVWIEGNLNHNILKELEKVSTIYINQMLVKGKGYIQEKISDISFKIYPGSFFQVNYDMILKMYEIVTNYYKSKDYNTVLDLYCGTGTMGMLISKYVGKVIGVELEKTSIESALEGKEINHIENIEFLQGRVEDYIDSFQKIDSIIVDPPRSGLVNHVVDTILRLSPSTMLYISCDPATLSRDLKLLSSKYKVSEIHPIDMFPNTYHVECVCVLKMR